MGNYLIHVTSVLRVEDDIELADYIADRERDWGEDCPQEIKRLKDEGVCTLQDEDSTTTIKVSKIGNI